MVLTRVFLPRTSRRRRHVLDHTRPIADRFRARVFSFFLDTFFCKYDQQIIYPYILAHHDYMLNYLLYIIIYL